MMSQSANGSLTRCFTGISNNMKYTFPLLVALLMLVSCKQECTISGTATGAVYTDQGHYLALMDQDYKQLDSCRVKDGTFTFTCPLNLDDMLTLVAVTPEDGLDESTAVIIIPDSKAISVDMDKSEVSGSPLSEEWIDFQHTMMDKWTSVQEEAVKMMEAGDRDGAVDAYTKLECWIREYAQSVVEKHLNDPVGIQALSVFASMSPAEETLALYEKCGEVVKNNLLLSEFMENLRSQDFEE